MPFKIHISLVLSITLVFLLTILMVMFLMPRLPINVSDDQLCVTDVSGDGLTCGRQKDVVTDFLNRAIEKSYEKMDNETKQLFKLPRISLKKYVANRYWDMKPAARYPGNTHMEIQEGDNKAAMVPVRSWQTDSKLSFGLGFQRYGIHMINGRIAVPVTGTYFIYSHLTMLHPSDNNRIDNDFEKKNGSIKHSMYKYSYHDKKETELLTSLNPLIANGLDLYNYYTSYLAGLVQLRAGEEVSLKVSNIDLLQYPESNFIGLNLI